MSFLAPFWLGLVAAAAIPIVLHLLRRRTGATVEFPAVRFLIKAQQEHQRELRLRNLALMLVRVLAIVALAMAAARPVGSFGGSGHAPTAVAIVVDNSLSSALVRDGAPVLAQLGRAASEVVAASTSADRVWLFTVDGGVVAGSAAVTAAIARLDAFTGRGDVAGTIARAVTTVQSAGLSAAHVVVVTDGQATALASSVSVGAVPVTVVTVRGAAVPNRAITDVRAEPVRWTPRGTVAITVEASDSTDVRVALGERTVARSVVGPDATLTVRAQAPTTGWLAGRVELPADELRGDDVRHFAIHAGEPPSYRVAPSAGPFMDGVIATLVDGGRASRAGRIAVSSAAGALAAPTFVVAPSDPVEAGAANRAFAAAGIPWRLSEVVRDATTTTGGDLDGVRVLWRYRLTPAGADTASILARAAGEPWIVAGPGYVLVGSPIDPTATTLPIDARFVPWVERVTQQYLVTDGGPILAAAPLTSVTLPVAADELVGADSVRHRVTGRTLVAPASPGVHWLRRDGRIVGAVVVDPEPGESTLTMQDGSAWAAPLAGDDVAAAADGAAAATRAFAGQARRPLVVACLIVLLLCLVAEAWIAREPRRVHS